MALFKSFNKTLDFLGAETANEISIAYLMKSSKQCSTHKNICGSSTLSCALVWQWLEVFSQCKDCKPEEIMKMLEAVFDRHVYVTGNEFTLADVVMFYLVESYIRETKHQERQTKYINLSRWFDHIQNLEGITNDRKLVFLKNYVYSR